MKNIFTQYNTTITLPSFSQEGINNRITSIKKLFNNEIDWNLFKSVLSDLHSQNGVESIAKRYPRKNCFNIEDWSKHFANNSEGIIISVIQLKLLFNYLREYHQSIIVKIKEDIYRHDNIPSGDDFRVEYLIFKSLENE